MAGKSKSLTDPPFGAAARAALVVVAVLAVGSGGVYTIKSGYRGVLLTFGKARQISIKEGLHFKIPFAQTLVKMEVKTQKYEARASAASKDLQTVSANIAVNFKLSQEAAPRVFSEIGLDYQERIIQPAVQECVKAVTAAYTAEELIAKRPEVKEKIKGALAERLASRGIVVEDISITDFNFSEAFNAAIEAKVTAEQQKLKAERDLQRIEVEAKQKEAEAIGARQAAIAKAEGEAEAIKIVTEQLRKSPEYIEWYKAQKWDGKLPLATGGATPFIALQER